MDELKIRQLLKRGAYLARMKGSLVYFLYKEHLAFYSPEAYIISQSGDRKITEHCAYSLDWSNIVDHEAEKASDDIVKIIEAELSERELESI